MPVLRSLPSWTGRHVVVTDAVVGLAGALFLTVPYDAGPSGIGQRWETVAPAVVMAIAVATRRVRPAVALVLMAAAMTMQAAFGEPEQGLMLLAGLVIYSATVDPRTRRAAHVVVALIPIVRLIGGRNGDAVSDAIGDLLIGITATAVALTVVSRRRERTAVLERTKQAETAREAERTLAASEERSHLARELHDIIAHSVTAMTLQARGAQGLAASDPSLVDSVLGRIERTGADAIAELRRTLDLLGGTDDDESAPSPGLADIDALVADHSDVEVSVDWIGGPTEVSPILALNTYRIVQEAVTNALRHSDATTIRIAVEFGDDTIAVRVSDNGTHTGVPGSTRTGRGLDGMRQRARVCHGNVDAGPLPDRGWRVEALLRARPGPNSSATP